MAKKKSTRRNEKVKLIYLLLFVKLDTIYKFTSDPFVVQDIIMVPGPSLLRNKQT